MRKQELVTSSYRPLFLGLLGSALLVAGNLSAAGTTYYVSATGDDANTGLDAAAPFATLAKAVATANADPAVEAVVVLDDLALTAPVEITGAYRLRGATADPADTVLSAEAKPAVTPLVKVSNASAVVADLTLSGGTASKTSGGNLWLNGGGTATNCLIREARGSDGFGGGVWNDNGLVTHCIIEDGSFTSSGKGAGLYLHGEKAVLAHSIVRNNRMNAYSGAGGGIFAEDGTIRYCVITNNVARDEIGHGGYGGAIHATSVVIDHCLIAGNRGGGCAGGVMFKGPDNVMSNCTVVRNTARDSVPAISGFGSYQVEVSDSIIWGNTITFDDNPGAPEVLQNNGFRWTNILAVAEIGASPVAGDPAFVDYAGGDYRLTASSAAIGAGRGGCDLGYAPLGAEGFSVGLSSVPVKALPAGKAPFSAAARNGEGEVRYRWRLDDLDAGTEGVWSPYAASSTFEPDLAAGHWRLAVEAQDAAGATAAFSRSFYVGAKTLYLVPAGTEGNAPAAPYDTPETAANDILEAVRYCADGSELIAADGDYGVGREVYVPAKATIRSVNGPEKTSIYRLGGYGKGVSSRVVHLDGEGAVLSGFAVSNGYYQSANEMQYGCDVVLYEGDVVTNCIITRAKYPHSQYGSTAIAAVNGTIRDTIVRDNDGGGGFGGAVSLRGKKALMADCVVSNYFNKGNYYVCGGGVWAQDALIERCVIRDNRNRADSTGGCGGGVYLSRAEIRDSVICDNKAGQNGAGGIYASGASKVVNCTVANNTSFHAGGLKVGNRNNDAVTVVNTIFDGNVSTLPKPSPGEPSWVDLDGPKCVVSHISVPDAGAAIGTLPLLIPEGPFFNDPAAGDYALAIASPCRDRGENGERSAEELDVARLPRIVKEVIDIGAHEYQVSSDLACLFSLSGYETVGSEIVATAAVDGADLAGLEYRWGIASASAPDQVGWTSWDASETGRFPLAPGRYLFTLEVRNAAGQSAKAVDETVYDVAAKTVYLVPPEKALAAPVYPYDSWEHAATNVPMALAAAGNGSTLYATNGHYAITAPVTIDRRIRFESIEGPDVTSIYRPYPRHSSYPSFRPVTMTAPGAFFGGFTVSNSIVHTELFNGAALLCQEGTVSNCVFSYNTLDSSSLGATVMSVDALVTHCVIEKNRGGAGDGYGVYQMGEKARTTSCVIRNNEPFGYYCHGAAVLRGGVLDHCVITGNVVQVNANGGHACGVKLEEGLVHDCLIALNQGGSGGGGVTAINGAIVNCTIVSNVCTGTGNVRAGGIVFTGDQPWKIVGVTNCIIHGNWNTRNKGSRDCAHDAAINDKALVYLSNTLLENWETIDPDAAGCRTGDPVFVDFDGFDWRLGKGSPCRDAGATLDLHRDGVDLDGRPRVVHLDRIDLGCYEADYVAPHTILILR